MKKLISVALALVMLLAVAGCGAGSTTMTMGTGGTAGTYYGYGGVLGQYIKNAAGINVTVVSTDGSKANIPSILLKAGDSVAVAEKSRSNDKIKAVIENFESRPVPQWLDLDKNNLVGKIVELPKREEIDLDVAEHLIVELYSK